MKTPLLSLILMIIATSCNTTSDKKEEVKKTDTVVTQVKQIDSVKVEEPVLVACSNDSLNAVTNIMSGITDTSLVAFKYIQTSNDYKIFSATFNKRWLGFDSSRLQALQLFREQELSKIVKKQATLFYPFSGPDILYAQTFFPDVEQYVMIGLEPVGRGSTSSPIGSTVSGTTS